MQIKGGFSMKHMYLAIIVSIAVGVIFAAIMYQPYGECIALNKELVKHLELMTTISEGPGGTLNAAYVLLAEKYDLKKAEYVASCRALM